MKYLLHLFLFTAFLTANTIAAAQSTDINGPAGSGKFGSVVTVLPNGNYVVCDPYFDDGAVTDVGAVYLYNGSTHALISTLKGSTANDRIGTSVTVLSNGNFVVYSTLWDNGAATDAGAVTWGSGSTGISGVVSAANSLVGSTSGDNIASGGVAALTNGNYVIKSVLWSNGSAAVGAVTWGNGSTGTSGVISSSNSLVGSHAGDQVGTVTILPNGNYVVCTPHWDNGSATEAGAVTWGNGATGTSGVISNANSLTGTTAGDGVNTTVVVLSNGNYVAINYIWDNGAAVNAGAVTWANGTTGISGNISSANSLTGSTTNDRVGDGGIKLLTNGNYVITSGSWTNGAANGAGAVTWCNAATGRTGAVSTSNSFTGSFSNDGVGAVTPLTNGNYVVAAQSWHNSSSALVGAVTWCNGVTGRTGIMTGAISLTGIVSSDNTGSAVTALTNGNYVVYSSGWHSGAIYNAGAATWCSGTAETVGTVTVANSLVGSAGGDAGTVYPLTNGNYIVVCYQWDNGALANAGAVAWGSGTGVTAGVISSSNALTGSKANDEIGRTHNVLPNGNYVISSSEWDNGALVDAGEVTWCNGATGTVGVVSSSNSLVGSTTEDNVGYVAVMSNGNFIAATSLWDNGAITDVGAITWVNGAIGITGTINSSNSLIGSTAGDAIGTYPWALGNNYLIKSINWDNGSIVNAGAMTFVNGATGITGTINETNSLIGSSANDQLGELPLISNGKYFFRSVLWDNGAISNAGAVTICDVATGTTGVINSCNSVLGNFATAGGNMNYAYNSVYNYTLVGRPYENIVTVYTPVATSLANNLDTKTEVLSGASQTTFIASNSCRLIASVRPGGASPVSGSITAKTWIEPSTPMYADIPYVTRHYEITPAANAATATAQITLYFTQQEFTDFNNFYASMLDLPAYPTDAIGKDNLRIEKFSGTSNNGTGLPGTYTNGSQFINPPDVNIIWNYSFSRWEVSFPVTGFSGFFVHTSTTLLAASSLELDGKLVNTNALLSWKTMDEQDVRSFDIERSTDNRNYVAIGNSIAKGTGSNTYLYTDNTVSALGKPVIYYRIKQKDDNGNVTYSNIIPIAVDKNQPIVMLYPNPVINEANIAVTVNKADHLTTRIVDNTGRVIQQQQWDILPGRTRLSINVQRLAKGMYYVELKGNGIEDRVAFVK